jgi:hypothetical protein
LAAENDRAAIDRALAKQAIQWPLRELAANVMRISRGAGKPYDLLQNCYDIVQCFQEYRETHGAWPSSSDIEEALKFREDRDYSRPHDERADAIEDVVSGALRMAAGRIVNQKLQADHGENELMRGIERIERHREELRAKWAAAARADRKPASKKGKQPTGRTKR